MAQTAMAKKLQEDRPNQSPVSGVSLTSNTPVVDAQRLASEEKRAPMDPSTLPPPSPTVPAKSPSLNVWNQRKEQMVVQARSTSQTRPLDSSSPNTNKPGAKHPSSSTISQSPSNGGPLRQYSVERSHKPASGSTSNGGGRDHRPPPPVEDAESWPEVGKAAAQPPIRVSQISSSKSADEKEEQDGRSEASQSSGPHKKSEKPKWVPLPPEEWQAPVEPHRSQHSQPHSRSSSQHPQQRHPRLPGSANVSQGPSKAASGRTSKASSVHSSPRRPPRGRPLPPTFDAPGMRPAEAPAPHSPRVNAETRPLFPDHSGMYQSPHHLPYYAPMPPFSPKHAPPHPQSYIRSLSNGFMPLPPPPTPFSHPTSPPPAPYPPYPYPPYGYHYPQQYAMYGYPPPPPLPPGPLPDYGAGYPAYAPAPTGALAHAQTVQEAQREATLPPLTDMTRAPPPNQADAVAGYRAVGPSNGDSAVGVVFGRFGQTETSGMRSPSPERPPLAPAQHMQAFTVGDSREDVEDRTDPEVQLAFGTTAQANAGPTVARSITPSILQVHTGGAAPPGPPTDSSGDTWEVRDYGYGFGRAGAPRPPPSFLNQYPQDNPGKPRRGYGNGPSYGGRRGSRGGRGYGSRGGRGPPSQAQYAPMGSLAPTDGYHGLFVPPPPPSLPFFDPYAAVGFVPPPMPPPAATVGTNTANYPQPRTILPTQLDPLRHQLLGQLEYYLSPENFAGDLFLRRNMDARGWIAVALLASFKRVRALTPSEYIVADTLALSRIVEVRSTTHGAYVRAARGEWEPFVLPGAAESVVEPSPSSVRSGEEAAAAVQPSLSPTNEDDEEEEVEFVLNNAATVAAS